MTVWFFSAGEICTSGGAVLFGAIYGVILCLFLYCKNRAISQGPVSLTSLIGNCAFIPATWFGVLYANERVSAFQLVGMCLMLIALFLCINPKKSGERLSGKWFLSCLAFFCAGGLIGMFYKVFGKSDAAGEVNAMSSRHPSFPARCSLPSASSSIGRGSMDCRRSIKNL